MYIIEKDFFYDDAKNSVWHINSESEKVSLPITASRLLIFFLENKGKVISRDELLNEIWEKYGISPSNNTLNQYTSLLRKTFESIGFTTVLIKTVPKVGFIVPGNLHFEYIKDTSNTSNTSDTLKTRKKINFPYVTTLMLIVLLSCFWFLSYSLQKNEAKIFKLGEVYDCPIYMLYLNSDESTKPKLQKAKELIDEYVPCEGRDMYIYHPSDSLILTGNGSSFITRCKFKKNGSNDFSGCYDVYKFSKK